MTSPSRWHLTPAQELQLQLGPDLCRPRPQPLTGPERLAAMLAYYRNTHPPNIGTISTIRLQVLAHYSHGTMRCESCGYANPDGLVLDHVHGDGASHRRRVNGNLALWLWAHGLPAQPPIQVLCATCNLLKARLEHRRRS